MDDQERLRTVPIFSELTDGDSFFMSLERQGLIHIEGKEIVVEPHFEKVFD